jgi:hypothetical protein
MTELNKLVQVITVLTCNWEVTSSNLSQDTNYPDFCSCLQSLQGNVGIVH